MPFELTKQLEHGTTNAIVARLTVQPLSILNHCKIAKASEEKFIKLSIDDLSTRLLRCWEVEQRLRAAAESCRTKFKPPRPGEGAVEIPQIPRLREECEDFLYQAKNYLRDLLKLFNLLWDTKYEDAAEWVNGKKGQPSVQEFIVSRFGKDHVNAAFINQYGACIEPFVVMRNAVEHPNPSNLVIKNFNLVSNKLSTPTWTLEKNGTPTYGPLSIVDDMATAVHNLLIWAEDVLVMWAQINLVAPQLVEIRVVAEERRDPSCSIRYCVHPKDAVLANIAKAEAAAARAPMSA